MAPTASSRSASLAMSPRFTACCGRTSAAIASRLSCCSIRSIRHLVRRIQISARHPYAEVRDNLLSAQMRPIDLLRAKLACFGATRFDPKSDRWVRITMFQNAPLFDEIGHCDADDWVLPQIDRGGRMTWSLNELDVETKKAIRGAGLSWGLAEEGGKAVRWLAAHGVDPLPALADVLERHDRRERITSAFKMPETGRWTADVPICPIALGVDTLRSCRSAGDGSAFVAGPVARPLLLAPFVAAAARILGRPLQLEADGRQIMLDERGDPSGDLSTLDASDACGDPMRS